MLIRVAFSPMNGLKSTGICMIACSRDMKNLQIKWKRSEDLKSINIKFILDSRVPLLKQFDNVARL